MSSHLGWRRFHGRQLETLRQVFCQDRFHLLSLCGGVQSAYATNGSKRVLGSPAAAFPGLARDIGVMPTREYVPKYAEHWRPKPKCSKLQGARQSSVLSMRMH